MAESDGLLNRCTGSNPYRGFESRPLRKGEPQDKVLGFGFIDGGMRTRNEGSPSLALNLIERLWGCLKRSSPNNYFHGAPEFLEPLIHEALTELRQQPETVLSLAYKLAEGRSDEKMMPYFGIVLTHLWHCLLS